jgi:hypothetical protein
MSHLPPRALPYLPWHPARTPPQSLIRAATYTVGHLGEREAAPSHPPLVGLIDCRRALEQSTRWGLARSMWDGT